jgi:hypothetical protein
MNVWVIVTYSGLARSTPHACQRPESHVPDRLSETKPIIMLLLSSNGRPGTFTGPDLGKSQTRV